MEQKIKRTGGGALALVGTILFCSLACETLAPEAERVKVTGKADDVAGCKILGTVESNDRWGQVSENGDGQGQSCIGVFSLGSSLPAGALPR